MPAFAGNDDWEGAAFGLMRLGVPAATVGFAAADIDRILEVAVARIALLVIATVLAQPVNHLVLRTMLLRLGLACVAVDRVLDRCLRLRATRERGDAGAEDDGQRRPRGCHAGSFTRCSSPILAV